MGSSDNVLRGGLTPKHVDLPELLRVLHWRGGPPVVTRPEEIGPGVGRYRTPAPEFELSRIEPDGGPVDVRIRRGVEIALCTEGSGALVDLASGARLAIRAGESALIPASLPVWRVEGALRLYRAAVGPAPTRDARGC